MVFLQLGVILCVPISAIKYVSITGGLPWESHTAFAFSVMFTRCIELSIHAVGGFQRNSYAFFIIMFRIGLGVLASLDSYTDLNFVIIAFVAQWPLWVVSAFIFA